MFAGELAKPSSICLGAFEAEGEDGALVGYLIVSRYVDAWHVMNVAVDPEHRGRGVATMLLERLFDLTADDARRGYTLEVRVSNEKAISLYERLGFRSRGLRRGYYTDNREDALIMWKDPVRGAYVILGIETCCDETAAALVTEEGEIRSSVVSSQAELHARYGGVVPEVASRRHLELVTPVIREALAEADATLDDVDRVAVTQGPGLIGALLVGLAAAKAVAWSRRLPLVPVDHLDGTSPRSISSRSRSSRRSSACSRAAATRCSSTSARTPSGSCSARRSTTRRARRSTRERACSGSATRAAARSTGSRATATPSAYDFPVARVPGLDFSFSGLKTALLYAVRDLTEEELAARRADLAASYQHAIVRALVERVREAAEQTGRDRRSRSSAASPRTRRCGRRSPTRPRRRSPSAPTTRR